MSTTRRVSIPLFDRNSPSLRPDLGCLTHGCERRSSMAGRPPRQRRGACLRAVRRHATLAAGGRTSTSASRPPDSEREAEVGSPSKSVLIAPSKTVTTLIRTMLRLATSYLLPKPRVFLRTIIVEYQWHSTFQVAQSR